MGGLVATDDLIPVRGPLFDGVNEANVLKVTRVNVSGGTSKLVDGNLSCASGIVALTGVKMDTSQALVDGYNCQAIPMALDTRITQKRRDEAAIELA